jgi:hypothetical protein
MSITLNLNQARELLEFFGGEDAQMTVGRCGPKAHSGPGLYAWLTEHPEEGSIKLDEEDRPNDPHDDLTPGADPTDRAGVTEVQPARPLNGIPATWQHGEGAYAQCGDCGRYTLDPAALRIRAHLCECGSASGWSGSFKKPGPDAKWSGTAPGVPGTFNTGEKNHG